MDDMIKHKLYSLSKSNFRSGFHLKGVDKDYINKKGLDVIRGHAYDFISKRLAPKNHSKCWQTNTDERAFCFYCPARYSDLLPWVFVQMADSLSQGGVRK